MDKEVLKKWNEKLKELFPEMDFSTYIGSCSENIGAIQYEENYTCPKHGKGVWFVVETECGHNCTSVCLKCLIEFCDLIKEDLK